MMQRGDVIVVDIPFHDRPGSKERPGIVVQCDRNNRKLMSTLVASVSTNLRRVAMEPTQFLVDPLVAEGYSSGLQGASAVKCENLFTVSQSRVKRKLGYLSDSLISKLDQCLKSALELT